MTPDPIPEEVAGETPSGEARDADRRGLVLAGVMVAIAALAALGGYVYSRMVEDAGVPEVPLVQADTSPTKKRPDEPGGMTIPNQDKLVYETLGDRGGEGTVERLLPPPEEPLPPPAPPEPDVSASPAPAAAPSTQAAPASEPETKPAPPATPEPASAPAIAAAPPAPAPPVATAGYLVQLAAFRKASAADIAWGRLSKSHRDLLGLLAPSVQRVDLGADKGVFYRLRAGPLGDVAAARSLCAKLKARKLDCLVVKR